MPTDCFRVRTSSAASTQGGAFYGLRWPFGGVPRTAGMDHSLEAVGTICLREEDVVEVR
jgi:hypothetical protein